MQCDDDTMVAERAHLGCTCKGTGDETTRSQSDGKERTNKAASRILPHSLVSTKCPFASHRVYESEACECTSRVHNGGHPSMHTAQSKCSAYSEACECTNWAHNSGNPSTHTTCVTGVSQSEVLGRFYNPNTTPKDKE